MGGGDWVDCRGVILSNSGMSVCAAEWCTLWDGGVMWWLELGEGRGKFVM